MSLSSNSSAALTPEDLRSTRPAKRRRLNLACNYCRSRKTRCDEQKPSCHACLAAGLPCITTDPKRPGRHIERREAGKRPENTRPSIPSELSSVPHVETASSQEQVEIESGPVAAVWPENTTTRRVNGAEIVTTPAGVVGEEQQPVVQTNNNDGGGEKFRGLLPIMKHITASNTVEIYTGWLNVAFARLGLKHRFTSGSSRRVDELHRPLAFQVPRLPEAPQCRSQIINYFQRVNTVYPVLDKDDIFHFLISAQTRGIETCLLEPDGPSHTISLLLVLELGAGGRPDLSPLNSEGLLFCKDMIGRLIGHPTVQNVQVLFLLALNFYHYDELASAWSIINLCISMARTIGMNKARSALGSSTAQGEETSRWAWWSIFAFERLLAFELGLRSSIVIDDGSHMEPWQFSPRPEVDLPFIKALTGLARLLGDIGSRCIQTRDKEEMSARDELQQRVAEKVRITGEACLQLTEWAEGLPDTLRPSSDLIYDASTFPHAAFLSLHYSNAILILTRNSLLISESAQINSTEVIAKDQPWGKIIRNGQSMVANIARRIIKLFIEAEEVGIPLLVPHVNAGLHALYVLAVHLLRHPKSRLAETDLNLITHAADFARQRSKTSASASNMCLHLDRVLAELNVILRNAIDSTPGTFSSGLATPRMQQISHGLDSSSSFYDHTTNPTPRISASTLIDDVTSAGVGILGHDNNSSRSPPLDIALFDARDEALAYDASYYQGMDMGAWMGLDEIGWDWNQLTLSDPQIDLS